MSSDFREALSPIMEADPTQFEPGDILKTSCLDTPLGPMIAIANDTTLYLLEFLDRKGLEREIERLGKKTRALIIPGVTEAIDSIKEELARYFKSSLKEFKTPFACLGSPFQKQVWDELHRIPLGETRSYAEIAKAIGRPTACRAVAMANGSNQLAIIIPCHRVINSNGRLGGYAGGLTRKNSLIDHERKKI